MLVVAMLTGCVTDRSTRADLPLQTGPDGPACQTAARLTEQLEVPPGTASEGAALADALAHLGEQLPEELGGYVRLLLSPEEVEAPDGSSGHTAAWRLLDTWSMVVCEARLLPASLTDQPDLGWIADDEWRPTGSDSPAPTSAPVTSSPAGGTDRPPTLEELVLVLATQRAGAVPWYSPEVTGMVAHSAVGTSVTVAGVETAALAVAACSDLHEVLGDGTPVDVVVRGLGGDLLALTDRDGCRTALGT